MNQELLEKVRFEWPELGAAVVEKIGQFHALLAAENERQNLTRLISPQDFVDGHLVDVKEMLQAQVVGFPAMDLGSGCGVPGLLAAAITGKPWILAESERHKADFLFRTAREMGLTQVRVVADRGESFLSENSVDSVVARAVGPVERIFGWLERCSTWNSLILFKGPAWEGEWATFNQGQFRGMLQLERVFEYFVGVDRRRRVIVRLTRRG
ncbi:RsmG family class I SAM-dependent methyltransferase [Bdellovibrionota bacterium FG-1]